MAPLLLTPAPPYSLPQVQTFSIFKGTGHRKSSPPAGTQSAGSDPARSLGRGVYQEGSCGGRREWRGGRGDVAPEDRGRGVSGAAGSGLRDSARGPRHASSSLGPASRAEPRKEERMGLAGLGWTLGQAHRKMTTGPRRREVGEHNAPPSVSSYHAPCPQEGHLCSPCPLPGSWHPRYGHRALDGGPRSRGQRPPWPENSRPQACGGAAGRRTRPRHLGMESSPAAEGRGEAAAVRRRPPPVPVHPSTAAVVPARAGVHPGRGAVGAISLVGGSRGFLVTRGGQGPDSLMSRCHGTAA